MKLRIFLIRHGESIANTGENESIGLPDHEVYLTEKGIKQAQQSATFLKQYIQENNIDLSHARVWSSPYKRPKQTFEEFDKILNLSSRAEVREDILLTEQNFGLFDSISKENRQKLFPRENKAYETLKNNGGKFWARLPMGESPFDVAVRTRTLFGTLNRDYEKHDIDTLFIFTHGTTLRCFLMQYLHYSVNWYEHEHNPGNCWIRYIDNKEDKGYIYHGQIN